MPDTIEEYLELHSPLQRRILEALAVHRQRILGDTYALPLFILASFSYRGVIYLAVGDGRYATDCRPLLEDCLEDIGLDRDLVKELELDVGLIALERDDQGEPALRHSDVVRVGAGFVFRSLRGIDRPEPNLAALMSTLESLQSELADFRLEFRETSQRLETLVVQGDAEIRGALAAVMTKLVEEGVSPEEAEALTEKDPRGLWDKVVRWFGGANPRNTLEEAVWAALSFVPGGTAVQLGVKVANAVRQARKNR